uniref:Cad gene transcriptional regulator n=1 Tax=Bradyrhizobium sp. HW13 TaxID=161773 RepID=Q8VUZ3_9BRAD|nr:cad gene transcriptional regulator [Bradyrhizobium sp. HW13]
MRTTVALDPSVDYEWSTDSVCAQSALSSWTDHLASQLTELHIEGRTFSTHRGCIRHIELGPLQLNYLSATSQRVLRSRAMIDKSSNDYLLLLIEKEEAQLHHYGRRLTIPEGSFVLLDNQQPFELLREAGGSSLAVRLEDAWLRRWLPHPTAVVATLTGTRDGWGSTLATALRTIASEGLADAILPRSVIADQLGAFLALIYGRPAQGIGRYQSEVLVRLKRHMQERLHDPELDPASIASSVGISKRHLHGLFAQTGLSFGAVLMDMRLERAAEMLRDRRFVGYRGCDVAWSCGFANASHFSRRFRVKFGVTPVDYRDEFEATTKNRRPSRANQGH